MAKIVVLAGGDDATAASAALDAASVDYEIVEPTAAALLHIVIGMVDDEAGEKEPKEPKEPKEEKPPKDAPAADEPPDDSDIAADASAVPESLGEVRVNGEIIEAVKVNARDTFLNVPELHTGAKTSYTLNESTFSFWPADTTNPAQRVLVERNGLATSTEVQVRKSSTGKAFLAVGADIADLFITK